MIYHKLLPTDFGIQCYYYASLKMNKVYLTYFVVSDKFLKFLHVKVVEKLDTLVFMTDLVVLFKFPKLIVS